MSLVNEALKRAKEAQEKQSGVAMRGAPLHTTEESSGSKMWLIALLAFVLALAVAGGGIWYWQKKQNSAKSDRTTKPAGEAVKEVNAAAPATPKTPAAPVPGTKNVTEPVAPPPVAAPVVAAATAPKTEPGPAPIVVDNRPVNIIPPTDIPEPSSPPPAPPVALKLQGILYSTTKPAAIFNGHTVHVGDRIGGMTITAIEPDRVTITYSNKPVVIRMP